MGSRKGGSSPAGTTTTTTEPWAEQVPYLTRGFDEAQSLYDNYTPQYYPGATYAGPNGMQMQALAGIQNWANTTPIPGYATQASSDILGGNYFWDDPSYSTFDRLAGGDSASARALSPYLNGDMSSPFGQALSPYLSGDRMDEGNPYIDGLTDSIMARVVPRIQDDFIAGGAMTSPEAARATSEGATAALAPFLFDQYQKEAENQLRAADMFGRTQLGAADTMARTQLAAGEGQHGAFSGSMGNLLSALQMAPGTATMPYTTWSNLYNAGAAQQATDQAAIEDAVARWNWGQQLPYAKLDQYTGSIGGNYGSSTTTPYFANRSANLMSSVLGGGMLGNTLFGGGWGAGLGALGGGALALLSDRRLKADIEHVGELHNGLRVYSYRYIDEPEDVRRIGLMADEVADENPDAVTTIPFGSLAGFQAVDYARAVE